MSANGSVQFGGAPCGHVDAFYHRIAEKEYFDGGRRFVQRESTLFAWSPELKIRMRPLWAVKDRLRADFRHGNDDIAAVIRYTVSDELGNEGAILAQADFADPTSEDVDVLNNGEVTEAECE